jgi:hypothetical protein
MPGTGKSCYALSRTAELARQPAYVVAHDPGWRLPSVLPAGMGSVCVRRHETVYEASRALASDARGVHVVATSSADEVIELGVKLGEASLKAAGEKPAVPVVVLIDEAVSMSSHAHYLEDKLKELLALRRHKHVGLVWTCQSPRLAHNQLLTLSTELVLFRLQHQKDFTALENAGVSAEVLARVPTLANHDYIRHVGG